MISDGVLGLTGGGTRKGSHGLQGAACSGAVKREGGSEKQCWHGRGMAKLQGQAGMTGQSTGKEGSMAAGISQRITGRQQRPPRPPPVRACVP